MSDYDGLHLCAECGDAYTTGTLCRSCAAQRAIDNDPMTDYVPITDMMNSLYDDGWDYEHIITISAKKCGHLSTVIRVLCHECVHMSRHKTHRWTHHDAEFRRRTKVISDELGFDPLEL